MPDALMIIPLFALLVIVYLNLCHEVSDRVGVVSLVLLVGGIVWFVLAHVECGNKVKEQELLPIYNIQTKDGIVQVALTGNIEFVNVSSVFHKLVDTEKCQVRYTTYSNMNYGMFCMMCSDRSYSLECHP